MLNQVSCAKVEKGGFDAIVVVKTDRITRSLKYAVWLYNRLIAHPTIRLVSIYDSVDLQTPDGYFTFMLDCLLSEREILINKWRSRIGIERAKKEGKYRGGRGRPMAEELGGHIGGSGVQCLHRFPRLARVADETHFLPELSSQVSAWPFAEIGEIPLQAGLQRCVE